MAPVKRQPRTRSHHKMKVRRRKPNIPELVYKFLYLGSRENGEGASNVAETKCRFCHRQKRRVEVLDSLDSDAGRNMANKRRDVKKNSKIHRVKRRQTTREQTPSCVHSKSKSEGMQKIKQYIQKALDFGVESGYLIPKDAAYRVLRVSSDLMNDGNYMSKARNSDRAVSQDRDRTRRQTPIRFGDYGVQEARRRRRSRKRRRRSRSGSSRRRRSRRRSRRRRGSDGEEIVEDDNDYEEFDTQEDIKDNSENANRDDENERSNPLDNAKTTTKRGSDGSDLSVDENDTDEDEEKKDDDGTQS
ncbi:uncharacterized protein LOC143349668 [Colletes latitarsis]|uniref:uncharacterized protein LOC143349668 n=1 Tax=Colletes latitarsis TaxID=2605962 RepID=UPI00403506D6